ncbi:hypothetical protein C4571_02140 [Candidatus Parcubacteria bacterium]|nr:MAG: hypothetical protein C4571_02140 [Candidatus Parcubacteria bacterium]
MTERGDMSELKMVQVRLKPHYLPHLHSRIVEMYEGPARQLADSGLLEILPVEKKRGRKPKA